MSLRAQFDLHWRVMPHSQGVEVASDWADKAADDPIFGIFKNCGLWTETEADILQAWAMLIGGAGLDIGANVGWTTAHIAIGCSEVVAVDPMFRVEEFAARARTNLQGHGGKHEFSYLTSNEFFASKEYQERTFSLVCIDGDHSEGKPLEDAINAHARLRERGVILLHDAIGQPVQEAVAWLVEQGLNCRIYPTPHVVAACWRGDFVAPTYRRDQRVESLVMPHLNGWGAEFI